MKTLNDNMKPPKAVFEKRTKIPRWRIVASRIKRRVLKHVWLLRGLIVLGIFLAFLLVLSLLFPLISDTKTGFYIGLARDFITTPEEKINLTDGRVNILILGKGGAGHEAPDLTDTIIFSSLSPEDLSVSLISIPRDIWIPSIRAKVNSSYYWGNQKQPLGDSGESGGGLILAKSSVEEVVGQNMHYGVVINFEGFREVVDILGGIEVNVETSFIDELYPVVGKENDDCEGDPEFKCRYEVISFSKGKQLMDGDTALKFVRSRNAEGDEGTDFARAKRQQLVIDAIKSKLLTKDVLLSRSKFFELKAAFEKYVETDLTINEMAILARWLYESRDSVTSEILPEEFLESPPISPRYDNLYVFIPEGDDPKTPEHDWSKVHGWVESILGKTTQTSI